MYPENRVGPRVSCRARFLGATETVLRGDIIDISSSGLCMSLEAPLDQGRELHLEFELPSGRVEAMGEVRWTVARNGRNEVGVKFARISAESLEVIAKATARRPFGSGFGWSQLVFRR